MTNEEALRILHCPSAYITDKDSEFAHTIPMFSKAYGQAMAVAFEALKQEPCEDCISRQAVMEHYSTGEIAHCHHISRNNLLDFVEQLPSVTPQPKIGRWIIKDGKEQGYDIGGVKTWYIQIMCSECGFIKTVIEGHMEQYNYCPNCGIKIEEVEE